MLPPPTYLSLPEQSSGGGRGMPCAHCSYPCGKVAANAMMVSRRWHWPERCPKRSEASNAPRSITVTDPLDIGPTSGVPPSELCQPNSLDLPPVQTLPDASPKGCAQHVLPAQAHSPAEGWLWKLCLPAPASQGGSWDLNGEENFLLGVVFLNIKQLCLTFKSGGRGDKQKASVHIQIGMLPPLFLGI